MQAKTYKATIKIKSGASFVTQQVMIQADNSLNARAMLESQYGKGCILSGPFPVS
ncbi:MAG: hypothetical protein KGJ21_08225 [Pseudomonadota bacterium]|nr:hypothetical protein [Pseudomonadota bacterium]